MLDDTSGAGTTYLFLRGTTYLFLRGTTYLFLRGTVYLFLSWVCVVHFVQLYNFTVLVQYFDVLYNYQERKKRCSVGFYLHLFLLTFVFVGGLGFIYFIYIY
jgi:hypothetical protein